MKQSLKYLLFFLLSFGIVGVGYAQDHRIIDSLQNEIEKFEAHKKVLGSRAIPLMDSIKANLFYELYNSYHDLNSDSAMDYAQKCLAISENIGYIKGIGNGYYSMGFVANDFDKTQMALEYFQKSLKIREEIGDKKGIIASYVNIGYVYYKNQFNYSEAIKNYLEALKLAKEIKDKWEIQNAYRLLGQSYMKQGNAPEALKNFQYRLNIAEEINDIMPVCETYNDIALLYTIQGNYPLAIKNFLVVQKKYGEIGDKIRAHDKAAFGVTSDNLAWTYIKMKNYPEALKYCSAALKLSEAVADTHEIAVEHGDLGQINYDQGDYQGALKHYLISEKLLDKPGVSWKYSLGYILNRLGQEYDKLNNLRMALKYDFKGLALGKEIGANDIIRDAHENLANINAKLGNYKAAYESEVLFKQYYDSIYNKENEKKLIGLQLQYEFDKKQDSITALQVKKDAVHVKEIADQKRIRNYILAGLGIVLFFLVFVFLQRNKIAKEKKRSETLLLNILPSEVAEELKATGSAEAKSFDDVTVLFTDFKDFTNISEKLTAKELVAQIDYCFKGFDSIMGKYNIEKIKTIGDSYMAAGGLPVKNKTHAADVVNAALEIRDFMEAHKQKRIAEGKEVFEIRIGIHTGPVVAGIVGVKKFAYDIWGDTVNTASRMESSGEAGKVNISATTYELVKDKFTCTYRGKVEAKKKGMIDMYFAASAIALAKEGNRPP